MTYFSVPFAAPSGIPVTPPGAVLDWNAQDIDGVLNTTRVNGNTASPWVSRGSVSASATGTGTTRLISDAGKINNLSSVSNAGSGFLQTGDFTNIAQPLTYGIVFRPNTVAGQQVIFSGEQDAVNSHQLWMNGAELWMYAGTHFATGRNFQAGKYHVVTCTIDGASSIANLDGTDSAAGNCGTDPLGGPAYLFAKGGGGSFPLDGKIARLVVYPAASVSRTQLRDYLLSVYGRGGPQ